MIERQVIVTWYSPQEKLPNDGDIVIATISGKSRNITFDHALVAAEYYKDEGWCVEDIDFTLKHAWLEVHAWCDLQAYDGGDK